MGKPDNAGHTNIRRPDDVREPTGTLPNYHPMISGLAAFVADMVRAAGLDAGQQRAPSFEVGPGKATVLKATRRNKYDGMKFCGGKAECERRRRRKVS